MWFRECCYLVTGPCFPVSRVVWGFFDRCLDVDCYGGDGFGGDVFSRYKISMMAAHLDFIMRVRKSMIRLVRKPVHWATRSQTHA